MLLYINYNMNAICAKLLQENLDRMEIKYSLINLFEVELLEPVPENKLMQLYASLNSDHIEIMEDHQSILVQKIKDAIIEMVFMDDKLPLKTSSFLEERLGRSYPYLSNLFSSMTYTNITTFVQMQKTERAKQLLSENELNITEIGWKLNYNSTPHFCNHFKNITGLTPTAFQRILKAKRQTE